MGDEDIREKSLLNVNTVACALLQQDICRSIRRATLVKSLMNVKYVIRGLGPQQVCGCINVATQEKSPLNVEAVTAVLE